MPPCNCFVKKKLHTENIYRWNDVLDSLQNNTGVGGGAGWEKCGVGMKAAWLWEWYNPYICRFCILRSNLPQTENSQEKNSGKFQKAKFEFATLATIWIAFTLYLQLHSIVMVLGIICNLEMI